MRKYGFRVGIGNTTLDALLNPLRAFLWDYSGGFFAVNFLQYYFQNSDSIISLNSSDYLHL